VEQRCGGERRRRMAALEAEGCWVSFLWLKGEEERIIALNA